MMGLGAAELVVLALIALLLGAMFVGLPFIIVLGARRAKRAGLVSCGACGQYISPHAAICVQCGEPRKA